MKSKKDEYQKALTAYTQAMKEYHKGDLEKAVVSIKDFIQKYPGERELVDRAQIYLAISQKRPRRETVSLKTFEDYSHYAVYKINQKDYEGALKLLEKALEFKTDEGKIQYLMADAYALSGRTDECLEALKKAIQKDKFFAILAQNEIDFHGLWEDKKFKILIRLI